MSIQSAETINIDKYSDRESLSLDACRHMNSDIEALISATREGTSMIFFYIKVSTSTPINTLLPISHIKDFTKHLLEVLESISLTQTGLIFSCEADGFLLVLPAHDRAVASKIPIQIASKFSAQFTIHNRSLTVKTSIGASILPKDSSSIEELIRLAMLSAHSAKESQRSFKAYSPALDEISKRHNLLLSGMSTILTQPLSSEGQNIQMHFQPKYSVRTGSIVGFEALCRWNHDALGNIAPGEFIPLAEKTKLITQLTRVILRKTMLEISENSKLNIKLPVAVNISALDLMDPTLLLDIRALLYEFDIPSNLLEIEVTETSIMKNAKVAAHQIENFRKLGLSVGIDDFGTGNSSLAYLSSFPVSHIKLDHLLTGNINHKRTEIIIEAIINLAAKLGIGVIAEGVENVDTLHKLQDLSCPLVQGYLLGKPKPRSLALSSMLEDFTRVAGYLNQSKLLRSQ
ncbi:putative bifunctional diguanylate cyclase/phosphodiesterase [Teredinibacter purpureus]|uniref:putative bifunctional diguanylate cyclase/phosphodiesterase n=1 Tax=Teredinibacter purpureus TaxID=2731756 RepID=UPI0009E55CFB|nr:GGDEF domain-containing phosphodiesterase [Teredinibacter purpureus]